MLTAIVILLVPLPWVAGWVVAVFVHELFHCMALCLCGKKIKAVQLNIYGAQMYTDGLTDLQMIVCSLAGPLGGLLPILIRKFFPEAAICAVLLTIFNLLPVFPLDGGRAFRAFVSILLPECYCDIICSVIENVVLLAMTFLCIVITFNRKMGIMPLVAAIFFMVRIRNVKFPCKSIPNAVQ